MNTKLYEIHNHAVIDHSLPAFIDETLRRAIRDDVAQVGSTYAKLHGRIDQFVHDLFQSKQWLIEREVLTESELEEQIKKHVPSKTYLHDYAQGGALCLRYTNTLANFFGISYTIQRFNPSDDLVQSLNLQGKI
ncbi:MAG: hypothetical protein ACRBCI_04310 [Cellvibrionaceae bacterium]